jgi:hypothetical protein
VPIGSIPGEKRGGRGKGSLNRKTQERLAIAAEAEARLALLCGADPGAANHAKHAQCVADRAQLALADTADGAMPLHDALVDHDRKPFGGNALAFLQTIYRDPRLPRVVRMDAAKAVIRYESPALSSTTVTADADSLALWRGSDARIALADRVVHVLAHAGITPRVHDVSDDGSVHDTSNDTATD